MLIADLFTGEIGAPKGYDRPPSATTGFIEFWQSWPAGPRKVAKRQCCDKWECRGYAEHAEHIRLHVEWMKTQEDWIKQSGAFICAPLVYLNQERWVDWLPVAIKEKPLIDPALAKIVNDRKSAAPMPANIREKLGMIRQGSHQ